MSFIKTLIQEATNCKKEDTILIEDFMRDAIFKSTLDWQTKPQLVQAAQVAHEAIEWMKTGEGQSFTSELEKEMGV